MQVVDRVMSGEAAGTAVLGAANAAFFAFQAASTAARPRRLAASALALVNAGLSLEAGAYVLLLRHEGAPFEDGAVLVIRTLLLAGVALISALAFRGRAGLRDPVR